jgi:hypothetical protein
VIVACKGMMEQAGEGSRIITGLGNKVREIKDWKGMRAQEGLGIEDC